MRSSLLAAIREREQDPTRYRDSGAQWRRPVRAIPDEADVQVVESELGERIRRSRLGCGLFIWCRSVIGAVRSGSVSIVRLTQGRW
jgi:hypothetical protein